MKEERRVTEWLADYRDSLDGLSTPGTVEARLRAEVRQRRRIPVAPWLLAAGAAAALLVGIWIGRTRVSPVPPVLQSRVIAMNPEPVVPEEAVIEPAAPRSLPVSRARLPPASAPPVVPRGPVAVFVMLPGSEFMPPAQDFQVLRVRIPRTRIQALGWPVNVDRLEERVLADVVVGEDGIARAVRLVQTNQ
jgi:hypothetical protein